MYSTINILDDVVIQLHVVARGQCRSLGEDADRWLDGGRCAGMQAVDGLGLVEIASVGVSRSRRPTGPPVSRAASRLGEDVDVRIGVDVACETLP